MGFLRRKQRSQVPLPPLAGKLRHVAFIMDGNGRWAKKRGLPREAGHPVGAKVFRKIALYCIERGVDVATFYAFSTENWKRPKEEVEKILSLFRAYLGQAMEELVKHDTRLVFLGDRSVLPADLIAEMDRLETLSQANPHRLQIAFNYGGRDEILHAVNVAVAEGITPLTEEALTARLYTGDCPPPDLIIRTAGEQRLSNFLLWQAAYAEFYFTDTLWPDFGPEDFEKAAAEFLTRKRRYGGL